MDPQELFVLGVDAGGTSTRAVLATADGHVVGRGTAGGANQRSSGRPPGEAVAAAVTAALAGNDPARVRAGVVGMAGAGGAGRAVAVAEVDRAWRSAGLSSPVGVVADLEVAFAAGTAAPDGLLLLAGTGAVAAAFRDGRVVHRCDGYGWLLGDEGSAVWLGREALRAVLAALDGRGAATALTAAVTDALLGGTVARFSDGEAHAQALIAIAYAAAPAELGRLAPLVPAHAATDATASRIASDAADRLLSSADAAARAGFASADPAGPDGTAGSAGSAGPGGIALGADAAVVVAGSLLLSAGPVASAVLTGLRTRFGRDPVPARDGAAGAAALALTHLFARPVDPRVHARLTPAH